MFDFLKRKEKNQGVLTNLKTVSRWVQELPAGDVFSAQEKVVQNLIQFNREDKGFTKDRLRVLMYLDEEAQEMQASLCLQYLRNARMSKAIESRLWMAIYAFYWEVTRSYHGYVMSFVGNPGGSKLQDMIPLVAARAIRGFTNIIKWNYFRYERIEEKIWLRLHNLFRIAEFDNFASNRITVYRGDAAPHSLMDEYSHALLLSLFGGGNLQPRELEMVDRWLDNWSKLVQIQPMDTPDHHSFLVDVKKGRGLLLARSPNSDPSYRYLSTAPLLEEIRNVHAGLQAGRTPVSLGLTEDLRLPEGYGLLKQVETVLSAKHGSERRQNTRIPMKLKWRVIHDLQNICAELEKRHSTATGARSRQPSQEEILDMKVYGFVTERTREKQVEREREGDLVGPMENWEQLDACETGLGFSVKEAENSWIKVGKLIALIAEDSVQMKIGVVTRLAKQDNGNRLIGIRIFENQFNAGRIKSETTDRAFGYVVDEPDNPAGGQAAPAIVLTGANGLEELIVDSSKYARHRQYHLHAQNADNRLIRLNAVTESGESWLRVGFETVTQ